MKGAKVTFLAWEPLQLQAPRVDRVSPRPNHRLDLSRYVSIDKGWFRPGVDREEATAIPAMVLPTGIAGELEAPRARTGISTRAAGSHRQKRHSMRCSWQTG